MRNPFKAKPVTKTELAAYRRGKPVRPEVAAEAARPGSASKSPTTGDGETGDAS
jgi:hypothetical protein